MSDMKFPTRPAPEPPKQRPSRIFNHPLASKDHTNKKIDNASMENFKLTRSQSAGKLAGNKKPPPRPPPPPLKLIKNSKSITSYFPFNKKQVTQPTLPPNRSGTKLVKSETVSNLGSASGGGLLIDLDSPPSSPSLTARTSSDNYSLSSYNSVTNSQIESGFEDDFDSLVISSSTSASQGDPWGDSLMQDKKPNAETIPTFELSNEDPKSRYRAVTQSVPSTAKPTIIRPKSNKPARPPPPKLRPASTPPTMVTSPTTEEWPMSSYQPVPQATAIHKPVDWDPPPDDWSPPMPTCPPPPPPPEALAVLHNGPSLPPRPTTLLQSKEEKKKPYCLAMYDYESGHAEDLIFKTNDVIYLIEKVNEDWFRGRVNNKEGMFPSNFVQIIVPLETGDMEKSKSVIALYSYTPETWDDLAFQEGDTVKVTRRINENWLYGECNGKQGQFPENYVTDISALYPSSAYS